MILPCITIGYAFPLGGGAGCGFLGGLLGGTFTCGLGYFLGGAALSYTVKYCMTDREQSYDFNFDLSQLGILFQENNDIPTDGTIEIPIEQPESEEVHTEKPEVPRKTAEEVINSAQPEQESYKTKQYNNPNGSFPAANNDFDDLGLINIEDKGSGSE